MRLKGKTALVTGASRGIGRGIAEVFADEGANVAVNYLGSEQGATAVAESIRTRGRRAMTVKADVSKRADGPVDPRRQRLARQVRGHHG